MINGTKLLSMGNIFFKSTQYILIIYLINYQSVIKRIVIINCDKQGVKMT